MNILYCNGVTDNEFHYNSQNINSFRISFCYYNTNSFNNWIKCCDNNGMLKNVNIKQIFKRMFKFDLEEGSVDIL
jgi:hypothetical protein